MATYTYGPSSCTGTDPSTTGAYTQGHEFAGRVVIDETVNVAANTSTISWRFEIYIIRQEYISNLTASSNNNVTVTIQTVDGAGNVIATPVSFSTGNIGNVAMNGHYQSRPLVLKSGTATIDHEADGSCKLKVYAYYYKNLAYMQSITVSGTQSLTDIPRASAVTSVTNVNIGSAPTVKWTPALSTYTFKISFSCGSWSYEYPTLISPASTSEQTFNSYSIPAAVANQITSSKTGTGTCKIETFSDSGGTKSLGSATKTFTITVPSSYGPTASMTITPVNQFNNLYNIANMTTFDYDCTASTAQSGATIASYIVTATNDAGTVIYTGTSSTGSVDNVPTPGALLFSLTVTDSRGYSDTTTPVAYQITEYNKPSVVSAYVTRGTGTVTTLANTNETVCPDFQVDEGAGNVARVTYTTSFTALTGNSLYVSISYVKNGSTFVTTDLQGGTNKVTYFKPAGGGFDPDEAYTFTISVYDTISTSSHPETMNVSLSAAWFPIDVLPDGSGIAFGKVADETTGSGVLYSAWDVQVDGSIASIGTNSSVEMSNDGIVFTDANNSVTGKISNVCYGVMFATCTGSDIDSSGYLDVTNDVFNADIKMVLAIIPTSDVSPVYFSVDDPDPLRYTIIVKRIDGGAISGSASFYVLALPA